MHLNLNLYSPMTCLVVLLEVENYFLSRPIMAVEDCFLGRPIVTVEGFLDRWLVVVALEFHWVMARFAPGNREIFLLGKFFPRLCFEVLRILEFPARDHPVCQ